jgi:hypothetical protein
MLIHPVWRPKPVYSCHDVKENCSVSFLAACSTLPGLPLLFQLQLGLSVVLGGVHAVVWVVDEVGPHHNVSESACVSRVPVCNALHVLGHLGGAVERLALLDLVNHFPHVHLDLAAVLAGSVEAACRCCQYPNSHSIPDTVGAAGLDVIPQDRA